MEGEGESESWMMIAGVVGWRGLRGEGLERGKENVTYSRRLRNIHFGCHNMTVLRDYAWLFREKAAG